MMKYRLCSRRDALKSMGAGFGMLAFAGLSGREALEAAPASTAPAPSPWSPKPPHFAPKAKNIIFVFLRGGLSRRAHIVG